MTGVQVPKRIKVAKLEHPYTRESLSDAFDSLHWGNFREQVYSMGVDVLGLTKNSTETGLMKTTKKHQPVTLNET